MNRNSILNPNTLLALILFLVTSAHALAQSSDRMASPTPPPESKASSSASADTTPSPAPTNEELTKDMSPEESVRYYRQRNKTSADPSRIYNAYVGVETGLGITSGTYRPVNSGIAYGINAGIDTPLIGFGLAFRHEKLTIWNTNSQQNITQFLLELNIFSYLLLNGGFQIGDIVAKTNDETSHSFGLGVHVGFDLHFTKDLTAGLGTYWTYVQQNSDKHSLFNLMIPLKYWF